MQDKVLVNILGAGRSGTTMLDLMLGNDSESFSLGEVHAWFRPFRAHHFEIDCNCGDVDCKYWSAIKGIPQSSFHVKAFDQLNVRFLIDSSKSLPWVIDNNKWAGDQGIKVVNIVIYKPLTSYAYSIWKRGESIDTAIHRYKTYYYRLATSGIPVLALSFSDLVGDPEICLEKICSITGQSYAPQRMEFWRRQSHHIFGSGGVRKQSRAASSTIRERENYPESFLSLVEFINEKSISDRKLRSINAFLLDNDLFASKGYSGVIKRSTSCVEPGWYYLSKLKSLWRKHFPEKGRP